MRERDNMDQRELIKKMWDVSIKGTYQPEDERLLTLKEAYNYLRVSRSTLFRLMSRGELNAYKVGNTLLFYERDLRSVIRPKSSNIV